ncbi:MAG: NAD(P)/FAD-dependent oxidoreductase [Methanoregula sp.]
MNYEVIIVGAGPAGSAAARECAQLGLSTLCLEEHGTIGYPVQCAGLLSTAAFDECRVPSERSVLNKVTGACVISGAGSELLIDAKTTKALVVDRGTLDREMAEAAANAGAEFRLRTAVYDVRGKSVFSRGVNGHEEIGYDILIAADGPRSTIARLLGMQRARTYLAGIQADMPGVCDPRYVRIYPDASPEFFGWSIPTGPGRIRVGICGRSQVMERFLAFTKKFGTNTTHLVTGTLPLGVMERTYKDRTLFVGDAAGFPKPTSGGGIYTGIRSARHAAAVAGTACEQGRYDDAVLAGYERRWREDFGRELELGYRLFGMRQKMSAEDTDALIQALNTPPILHTIEEYGDMDRPGALIKKLLVNPAILRLLRPLVRTGLHTLFLTGI